MTNKPTIKHMGKWPDNKPWPPEDSEESNAGWVYKGDFWVLGSNQAWINIGKAMPFPVEELNLLGCWPATSELPSTEGLNVNDAVVWKGEYWRVPSWYRWEYAGEYDAGSNFPDELDPRTWVTPPPAAEPPPLIPAVDPVAPNVGERRDTDWLDKALENTAFEDPRDPGSLARELLARKAEVKRLKRKRIFDRCLFWLLVIAVLSIAGHFAYKAVMANYETGRYSDERQCKVVTDNLTITGKRTYSYPYKSLFGFRLIDESKVSEQTVINVTGDKMAIIGLTGKRWWGYRIGQGERGIQILKPADHYTISTDKGLAVVTYKGFCQAVGKVSQEADPKAEDQAIID